MQVLSTQELRSRILRQVAALRNVTGVPAAATDRLDALARQTALASDSEIAALGTRALTLLDQALALMPAAGRA